MGLFATKPVEFSKDQGQITDSPVLIQKKAVSTFKNDNWQNWDKNVTIELQTKLTKFSYCFFC